ncbi:MAG TPA: serine/threonine-protein kinase [Polyangiaceae bacterium]|nr:serine/threonine-protein kinase [Polyangiaceae bacterium]
MSDQPYAPGLVIAGKYRLTAKLGQGGMGAVWRADHLTLNAPVAIKLLDPSIATSEEGLARFNREAQSAAALRSVHVVQTFDYGVHERVPYIVMELLVGQSLADRITSKGPLSPQATASMLKQVARAITRAHQAGIIHRDLKPDNIFLVDGDDEEPIAKVLDFGIAKAKHELAVNAASKTRTGALLGTPFYMSPEQAQGTVEVDYRTDLWSLGVITYEAMLGKRPFESEALGDLLLKICVLPLPVPSRIGKVPAGFDAWFAKAAHRDPVHRFATASEMAKALERVANPGRPANLSFDSISLNPPHGANPAGDSLEGTEFVTPEFRKKRPVALLGGAALLLGAALTIVLAMRGGSEPVAVAQPARALASPVVPAKPLAPEAPAAVEAAKPPIDTRETPPDDPSPAADEQAANATKKTSLAKHGAARPASAGHAKASSKKGDSSFDPLQMRR